MIKRRDNMNNIWDYTDIDLLNNIRWYLELDEKKQTSPFLNQIRELFEQNLKDIIIEPDKKQRLIDFCCLDVLVYYLKSPTIGPYNDVVCTDIIKNNIKEFICFNFITPDQQEQLQSCLKKTYKELNQILFFQEDKERAIVFEKTKKIRKKH